MSKSMEFLDKMIDLALEHPELAPERVVVIDMEKKKLNELLSPSRLEIIETLKKKNPESVGELAKMLGRPIESVSKDLNILSNHGLLELVKVGRIKKPKLKKEMLIIPL